MAKRNSRSTTTISQRSESDKGNHLPVFDENALSTLTAKIEQGFQSGQQHQESPEENRPVRGRDTKAKLTDTKRNPNPSVKKSTSARGFKRDAKGNKKLVGSNTKTNSTKSSGETVTTERTILLREILALGGNEADLDLIADAASDNEDKTYDNAFIPNKTFHKDLAEFVKGLGIEGHVVDNESDAESVPPGVTEQSPEEWKEAQNSGSEEASDIVTNKQSVATLERTVTKGKMDSDNRNRLIFAARPDWHASPLPLLPASEDIEPSRYTESISNLKEYASSLLEADSNLYTSKHLSASSSHKFLSTIMSSGTLSDKISALTLVVQESPVHTTKSFESLLNLAKKRSRGQAVTALGALKDLLGVGVVLPSDRRLRSFATQPALHSVLQQASHLTWTIGQPLPGQISEAHLISWAYEDWLKESYFDMLKVLEGWCNDEVEYARSRAVTFVYELLREKPEQEANLLRLLVNKLGDPDKKIASRTSYLLLQLQISHPLMKLVIIRSIESELLLRPGQSPHAKYYAINTLNQTILSGKEEEIAKKLLDIYFELFVALLRKPDPQKLQDAPTVNRKGQVQGGGGPMGKKARAKATKEEEAKAAGAETTEKLISAVLTGVNRAFPFAKSDDLTLEKHMDTLFRITHSSNFNTSIQALMLIEQLATTKHLAIDRFYRTLYESLLDPRLVMSSKHALYLNLLYRALRADLSIKRVKAFAKRLLQVMTLHQPPFICGVLYLLKELEGIFPGLKTLLNDPESYDGSEEEVFRDVSDTGQADDTFARKVDRQPLEVYDGRKRDPEHTNAHKSCLWESVPFIAHFHPSVSLFADCLQRDIKMPPKPDLTSHSLASFLDRFVYRNAKAAASGPRGSSIMQPLSGGESKSILLSSRSTQQGQEPLNSEAFWRKRAEDVAADEVFFHKYFSQIGKTKHASKKLTTSKTSRDSDAEEDENEDEIWQALVDSRPEMEGPSDDESDLEMLDLEDSDSSEVEFDDSVGAVSDDEQDPEDFDDMLVDSEGGDESEAKLDDLFKDELEGAQTGEVDEPKTSETSRMKKRRLKGLPTFASVEDYAALINNEDGEDL